MTPDKPDTYLFAGACGAGMAPLALFLRKQGKTVYGWDDAPSSKVQNLLVSAGVVWLKASPSGLPLLPESAPCVVHSSALKAGEHPFLVQAAKQGLCLKRRGVLLSEVSRHFRLAAVCGSHGKTTTTAHLIRMLHAAHVPCSWVLGGFFNDGFPPGNYSSESPWLVAEIDESDGTIEGFSPELTVAVNFDWDHSDHYPNPGDLENTFRRLFVRSAHTLIPDEDSILKSLAANSPHACIKTGRAGAGDFLASNHRMAAAAASCITPSFALPPDWKSPPVFRRQESLFRSSLLEVFTDYAHHPTEISALLASLPPTVEGPGAGNPIRTRTVVVFQPHRYSRTLQFSGALRQSLKAASEVLLMPVYAASEAPLPDATSEAIATGTGWPVLDAPHLAQELAERFETSESADSPLCIREPLLDPDIPESPQKPFTRLLFVGAGDIDAFARSFAQTLRLWEKERARFSSPQVLSIYEPLLPRTTLRVGGPARFFAEPASIRDLRLCIEFAQQHELPWFVLGRGSNLIVADEGFDGLVISFRNRCWQDIDPLPCERLRVGAGVRLKELCGFAARMGFPGLEFLEGIPGTVGGSLCMNAGAMGSWIFDRVESVTVLNPSGSIQTRMKKEFTVGYRCCNELQNAIVLEAVLCADAPDDAEKAAIQADILPSGSNTECTYPGAEPADTDPAQALRSESIREKMEAYSQKRKKSQPREPSAGCIFKNPPGGHAGALIDRLGLKGTTVGGAMVSPVHANFIVNTGNATCKDIIELVDLIHRRVKTAHGIDLEPEAILLGTHWNR